VYWGGCLACTCKCNETIDWAGGLRRRGTADVVGSRTQTYTPDWCLPPGCIRSRSDRRIARRRRDAVSTCPLRNSPTTQLLLLIYRYFASAAIAVDSSHVTASSSASWSRFSPPSNFVNGHVSTMWFMVCRWPQSQLRWFGETQFVQVSTTWALTCPETVHQRPCMTREIETWLSNSRVGNNSVVGHRSRRPALSLLPNCIDRCFL